MTSRYKVQFLHSGTHCDFAWLVCDGMKDDPMDLYKRLPGMKMSSQRLFLGKVKKKADGDESLPRNQMKVVDFDDQRFLSFKDNSTQTRFLAVKTICKNAKGNIRTLYLIVSGIEGKKEDEIPKGNLTRAKSRWREAEELINRGELKNGGW